MFSTHTVIRGSFTLISAIKQSEDALSDVQGELIEKRGDDARWGNCFGPT